MSNELLVFVGEVVDPIVRLENPSKSDRRSIFDEGCTGLVTAAGCNIQKHHLIIGSMLNNNWYKKEKNLLEY